MYKFRQRSGIPNIEMLQYNAGIKTTKALVLYPLVLLDRPTVGCQNAPTVSRKGIRQMKSDEARYSGDDSTAHHASEPESQLSAQTRK